MLTPKNPLEYEDSQDLIKKLRPGVDGVVLQGWLQESHLPPQVWDQIPQPEQFLTHLCQKMGASPDLWRKKHLMVFTYQVQEFQE